MLYVDEWGINKIYKSIVHTSVLEKFLLIN